MREIVCEKLVPQLQSNAALESNSVCDIDGQEIHLSRNPHWDIDLQVMKKLQKCAKDPEETIDCKKPLKRLPLLMKYSSDIATFSSSTATSSNGSVLQGDKLC